MYKLTAKRNTNRFTENELLDNICNVWDYLGRQPNCREMDCYPSVVTLGTYYNRFGSWKVALNKFIAYKNGTIEIDKKEYAARKHRKTINNSTRYDIMKRDYFKCTVCGDSPSSNINTILEIDHILPVAKGGGNENENLRTICKSCNVGKCAKT